MKRLLGLVALVGAAAVAMGDIDPFVISGQPTNLHMSLDGSQGGVAEGTMVYNNTAGALFSSGAAPRRALDDISANPGPGAGGPNPINGINIGFIVQQSVAFDIQFDIYNTLNSTATPVNSGYTPPSYRIAIGQLAPGAYQTGMLKFPPGGNINIPDDNWAIDILFFQPGTTILSTAATHLFAGGPVVTGSSQDVYWRDANGNSIYEPSDARTFGGGTLLANFYLQFQTVPEPASMLLLGLGAMPLLRRRR